jgi:hypothetical protein
MKKKFIKSMCLLAAAVIALMPSCSKDKLAELNAPQNAVGFIIPENIFTNAILNMPRSSYGVIGGGMQYYSTYKEVPAVGDKYYSFNGATVDFVAFYTNNLNRLYVLDKALTAADVNQKAIVRILKVYTYHQLTDVAGDVPYFDALKGESAMLSPKYDTQQAIYMDMLKELNESAQLLSATNPTFTSGDLFYKGDITKWKKFAYTLMLRLGMRLSEVSPADAQTWVKTAIAGGVMTTDEDIAKIVYTNTTGNINTKTQGLSNGDYASPGGDNVEGGKYAATFIDKLKATNDPRLSVISTVWQRSGATYAANNTPGVQRGMVSGSLNTFPADFDTYSEPSQLVLNLAAPIIILGPAEANLLLAEAAVRGWYTGASATTAYNAAVRSGMTQWALWPTVGVNSGTITTAQIDAYLVANPYLATASTEAQLEQINTQKWLSMFGDDYEVYANWRRTGYPVLKKVNYTGNVTGGLMFRRFALPISERLVNQANYSEALTRQGFSESTDDNLVTKVWWDKKAGLPFNFN